MNKYLYLIKKLKIKPWIKYWLIKQTEFKGVLSGILEGTSFYLTDSLNMKFKMFKIYGRTTQESTTGKNLFNEVQLLEATDWQVNNGVYSGTIDNWFSKFKNGFTGLSFETNTQYTISLKGYTTGGTPRIKIVYTDSTSSTLAISASSMTEYSITSTSGKTISSVQADFGSGSAQTLSLSEIQIEKGTSKTSFEPYTGGEPAPNPNYPQDIKNTGDNGSVNEKVSNSDGTQEQNISFPLAEGQKLMEGDYLADDGVHHKMGEVVLDGTENWVNYTSSYDGRFYCTTKHFRR